MRKHGGTPSRRDKHVTLAAISPPGVARGRFVGGQQSGLAGCKPPPLFTRGASSCSSQGRRQGEPWGASPRPSAPTYLPTCVFEPDGQERLTGSIHQQLRLLQGQVTQALHHGYHPGKLCLLIACRLWFTTLLSSHWRGGFSSVSDKETGSPVRKKGLSASLGRHGPDLIRSQATGTRCVHSRHLADHRACQMPLIRNSEAST